MKLRQINRCLTHIRHEKDDRNLIDIYVDFEKFSVRCDSIKFHTFKNGIECKELMCLYHENFAITVVSIDDIQNIRYTDSNNETMTIIN